MREYALKKYSFRPVQAVDKLAAAYRVASAYDDVSIVPAEEQIITRIEVESVDDHLMDYKYNSGFFFEMEIESLKDILPVCSSSCQTMTYLGIEQKEIRDFFYMERPRGIDRVVPIGKSLDFYLIWDGYDLIREMSRRIPIQKE